MASRIKEHAGCKLHADLAEILTLEFDILIHSLDRDTARHLGVAINYRATAISVRRKDVMNNDAFRKQLDTSFYRTENSAVKVDCCHEGIARHLLYERLYESARQRRSIDIKEYRIILSVGWVDGLE